MDLRAYKCPITDRFLDPFEAYRLLGYYTAGRWNEMQEAARTDTAAHCKLIEAGRRAMRMPRPDEKTGVGWVEPQVEAALTAFAEYVAGKGGRHETSPPSSPPSVSGPRAMSAPCSDCP